MKVNNANFKHTHSLRNNKFVDVIYARGLWLKSGCVWFLVSHCVDCQEERIISIVHRFWSLLAIHLVGFHWESVWGFIVCPCLGRELPHVSWIKPVRVFVCLSGVCSKYLSLSSSIRISLSPQFSSFCSFCPHAYPPLTER